MTFTISPWVLYSGVYLLGIALIYWIFEWLGDQYGGTFIGWVVWSLVVLIAFFVR